MAGIHDAFDRAARHGEQPGHLVVIKVPLFHVSPPRHKKSAIWRLCVAVCVACRLLLRPHAWLSEMIHEIAHRNLRVIATFGVDEPLGQARGLLQLLHVVEVVL